MVQPLQQIPTNIITGFLGAGKTTAILHLLKNRPDSERWAVLVNEFGEVGVDGTLLSATTAEPVTIREVPGGCLCCAASVPMKVALNQLLKEAKPHRLLIEPTGLGHPRQILDMLSDTAYQSVLDLQATLTLVDARKVNDQRYREHPTFQQQLAVADLVIANHADQYRGDELQQLQHYLQQHGWGERPLYPTTQAAVVGNWLSLPHFAHTVTEASSTQHGTDFYSKGWRYDSSIRFDLGLITRCFQQLKMVRLKAALLTREGAYAFNQIEGAVQCTPLPHLPESRIEIIDLEPHPWETLEQQFLQCCA